VHAGAVYPGGPRARPDLSTDEYDRHHDREGAHAMSSTTDKIEGLANEAVGNVKQAAGKATGNDKLVAEGKAQELKGEAQKTVGDVKDGAKSVADKIIGKH
jgi:uncharacterized protein YjbJ (UPF0337 family)